MASPLHPSAPPIPIESPQSPATPSIPPVPSSPASSHLPTEINSNHEESVELRAVAEDFPNMMKFTSTPAMLDLCITDSLMPSPRFMQKMTQDEDVSTPPSSIRFEDELLMQAGTLLLPAGEKQIPSIVAQQVQIKVGGCSVNHAPPPKEPVLVGNQSTSSRIKNGAWNKPLSIPGHHPAPVTKSSLSSQETSGDQFSTLSMDWPDLSGKNPRKNNTSSAQLSHTTKGMTTSYVFSKQVSDFIPNDQEYPWAARMKGKCNLHQVTVPNYMDDGTPLVNIPSNILLEGLENQKEYVVGQFYRCLVPSGGQTHAVINRLWGRKGRIFTRKLGEFSYLFHIPDEQTRNWVIQRGLWHVDDCLMFVSPWSPSETISLPAISTIPVWLTLKNIPNQLYSFKGIDWIASGIGAPMLSSKPWLDPTQMGEAKILVEVKLNKPFPQKVALKDKSGSITMVDVLYSWLPPKCPKCGQLGHKASRCLGLPIPVLNSTVSAVDKASVEINIPPPNSEAHNGDLISKTISLKENGTPSVLPLSTSEAVLKEQLASSDLATLVLPSVINPEVTTSPKVASLGTDTLENNVTCTNPSEHELTHPLSASSTVAVVSSTSETLPTAFIMVPNSNPFSVLDSLSVVVDTLDVCVEKNEEIKEDHSDSTMGVRNQMMGTEFVEEEDPCPKSRVGRPLKPSQKVQEQWITVHGRGKRGGRGRGGRGLFN